MTARATRPKCVLLDANVVIEAYKLGVWDRLMECVEIIAPSIVARDEALFFSTQEGGVPQGIDLPRLIEEGKIGEVTGSTTEIQSLLSLFDSVFVHGLDNGETEALALVNAGRVGDAPFCTGDAPAIKALAMIGHADKGISLERLLRGVGLHKTLSLQFTEGFFRSCLKQGSMKAMMGEGLKRKR